jgi:hypothetical protein
MADHDTDSVPHSVRFPAWQRKLQAALHESNPEKLRRRVQAAEGAIFLRCQELADGPDGHAEQQAIADATRILRRLQIEKLGYPDWNKQ